jgi:hypothetical protein
VRFAIRPGVDAGATHVYAPPAGRRLPAARARSTSSP